MQLRSAPRSSTSRNSEIGRTAGADVSGLRPEPAAPVARLDVHVATSPAQPSDHQIESSPTWEPGDSGLSSGDLGVFLASLTWLSGCLSAPARVGVLGPDLDHLRAGREPATSTKAAIHDLTCITVDSLLSRATRPESCPLPRRETRLPPSRIVSQSEPWTRS